MGYIAITGGIGSGKSYVCKILRKHGVDVYDCDAAAKRLWATDSELQEQLKELVGDNVYINNVLQKKVLALFLLQSEENKQAVDDLIHPAVARDFVKSGKQWLESAILFDSGFYRRLPFEHYVCVTAPLETRINRVMKRDGITRQKALEWIGKQWPQEKVAEHCDFVINNDGNADLDEQASEVLSKLS